MNAPHCSATAECLGLVLLLVTVAGTTGPYSHGTMDDVSDSPFTAAEHFTRMPYLTYVASFLRCGRSAMAVTKKDEEEEEETKKRALLFATAYLPFDSLRTVRGVSTVWRDASPLVFHAGAGAFFVPLPWALRRP